MCHSTGPQHRLSWGLDLCHSPIELLTNPTPYLTASGKESETLLPQRVKFTASPCLCITGPLGYFYFSSLRVPQCHIKDTFTVELIFWRWKIWLNLFHFDFISSFRWAAAQQAAAKAHFILMKKEFNDPLIWNWSSDKMALVGYFDRNIKLSESLHIHWCMTPPVAAGSREGT